MLYAFCYGGGPARVIRIASQTALARGTEIKQTVRTGDWFGAEFTLLGEQLREARHAVRLVVVRCELVVGEYLGAAGTAETLAVPRRLVVRHAALRYRLQINARPQRTRRSSSQRC